MPVSTRPTPEQLLSQLQAEEAYASRGRLKVFLGYAAGVGKSFRMLDEGRRRRERGEDVVVGAIQRQSSAEVESLSRQLEIIPLRLVNNGLVMDVPAILRRHPGVCLVDELAFDNPPGESFPHRWQEVEQLLSAGISVLTAINLQYVAERQREVAAIRGKTADVSVPESFLRKADEIVVVDAPAEFCANRTLVSSEGSAPADQERMLSQLREIALLLAADVVDEQLETYLRQQGVAQLWGTQERILVCLTPKTNATRMIARARLTRERFHGALFAVYVSQQDLSADDQVALEHNLAVARQANAEMRLLEGGDEVGKIIDLARREGITQIFIGHSQTSRWRALYRKTTVDRLIGAAEGIDVKLFPC